MSDDREPLPEATPPSDLSSPLREAVRAIVNTPPPVDGESRTLERASALAQRKGNHPVRQRIRRLVAAGVAAAVLVGLASIPVVLKQSPSPHSENEERIARTNNPNPALGLEFERRKRDSGGVSNTLSDFTKNPDSTVVENETRLRNPHSGTDEAEKGESRREEQKASEKEGNGLNDLRNPRGAIDSPPRPVVPDPLPRSKAEGRESGTRLWAEHSGEGLYEKDEKKKALEDGDKGKSSSSGPQTWKRDRQSPTVARVYVGDGNALELISLQVTVTIDGPRARTLVDHVFRNPHDRQLEGTFEYPLPTGASPSYYAMFLGQSREQVPARFGRRGETPPLPAEQLHELSPQQIVRHVNNEDWGRLQEAHLVNKEKALETYEDIVRGRVDPALLEYAGGNTFSGRVFPIPRKGYNRVLLAYEELLPMSEGKAIYRFALPRVKLTEMQFSLQARKQDMKDWSVRPDNIEKTEGKKRLTYRHTWKKQGPGGEVLFAYTPTDPQLQVISGQQGENGLQHLYTRIRPQLKSVQAKPFAHHAIFLLDTSLSEHPERFDVNMKLLRRILESDKELTHFNVLTFNVGAAWVQPRGWIENTPQGREQTFKQLDGLLLEGATDLECALDKLVKPGFVIKPRTPVNAFVLTDGQITWGESDINTLVTRFEQKCPYPIRFHCYRTGLGAENEVLFTALTRRGGAVFQCLSEAELKTVARAHREQCWEINGITFLDGPRASDILVAGRKAAVYPGGELILAARCERTGKARVKISGTYLGEPREEVYTLEVNGGSELAARGWGEVAVAELLALHDPKLESLTTAYCQEYNIGSRVASFLVLENEADFKRLNLEQERGKTVSGDLAAFLAEAWSSLAQESSPRERWRHLVSRVERLLAQPKQKDTPINKLLTLLGDQDLELPSRSLPGSLLSRQDVEEDYLKGLNQKRPAIDLFTREARRRLHEGDSFGAVRALSSIIEEYPGRSDALRLVGYRLLDLEQPEQAVRLFAQVLTQRPFEAHSYRDLALSLQKSGHFGLAALQYEIILAGTWHNRFGPALKTVATEEYSQMLRETLARHKLAPEVSAFFKQRARELDPNPQPSDLRVTISWNTDATDIDLWVIEPDGTKCFYSHPSTKNGGELSTDQTQGYGPERYRVQKASLGEYRILVNYFAANNNLLSGETNVQIVVTRYAGTPQEQVERHTVVLKKTGETVEVTRVKY